MLLFLIFALFYFYIVTSNCWSGRLAEQGGGDDDDDDVHQHSWSLFFALFLPILLLSLAWQFFLKSF